LIELEEQMFQTFLGENMWYVPFIFLFYKTNAFQSIKHHCK